MKANKALLSLLAVSVLAAPAFAGGPIAQCASGQAFVWGSGGANIPFNPDMGDLVTAGDNAAAVALVEAAFQVWEDVPTSTASYVNAGPLPVDVTGANVLTYWAEPAPDGLSPVIFDFDGTAGATLGFPSGVLGVAGIAWVNTITCEALEGGAAQQLRGGAAEDLLGVLAHEEERAVLADLADQVGALGAQPLEPGPVLARLLQLPKEVAVGARSEVA